MACVSGAIKLSCKGLNHDVVDEPKPPNETGMYFTCPISNAESVTYKVGYKTRVGT